MAAETIDAAMKSLLENGAGNMLDEGLSGFMWRILFSRTCGNLN
jgi:hypothetical protein